MVQDSDHGFIVNSAGEAWQWPAPEPVTEEMEEAELPSAATEDEPAEEGSEEGENPADDASAAPSSAKGTDRNAATGQWRLWGLFHRLLETSPSLLLCSTEGATPSVHSAPSVSGASQGQEESVPPGPEFPMFLAHPIMPATSGEPDPWQDVQPAAPNVPPRLFVVYENGDGYELLSGASAAEIIKMAEADGSTVSSRAPRSRPAPLAQHLQCRGLLPLRNAAAPR